jgi:hypothetical protein
MGERMKKRPLENVAYADIANARKGARSKTVNIACPVCGPTHKGDSAKRPVMRTWTLDNYGISVHCVRCGVEGWVAPDGGSVTNIVTTISDEDDEHKKRRIAEAAARIWKETYPIAGTAGEAYLNRRRIDLAAVPNYGGLRWHPKCPWKDSETTACIVSRFTDAISGEPGGIHRRPINGEMARSLGRTKGCTVRLWPDEDVMQGLVIGEGIETCLAASQIEHRGTLLQPVWACGYAINLANFPVLPGIESLTILVDNDASGTGQDAAAACARRWRTAGREVRRLVPNIVGQDFNDIIRGSAE